MDPDDRSGVTPEPLVYHVSIDPASPALAGLPPGTRIDVTISDPDDPAEVLLNTEQAATAAHVKPALIRRWAARRLLQPVNPDDPRPLYRELDVLTVEAMTRREKRAAQLAAETAEWAARESA